MEQGKAPRNVEYRQSNRQSPMAAKLQLTSLKRQKRIRMSGYLIVMAVVGAMLSSAPKAITATKTWDGGAGTANWQDGNNWNANGVPGATDTILLDNSSVATLPSAMNTSGLTMTIMGITYDTANSVTLGNTGTSSGASSSITLNGMGDAENTLISLTNNATGTFTIQPTNSGGRTLTLTLGASGTLNVTNAAGTLAITTTIAETGGTRGITKTGSGTLILGAVNSYTGLTTVTAGTVREGVSDAISNGGVTVNGSTAVFDLGASHSDTVGTVTVDGGGSITGTGTSTLTSTGTFEMKSGSVSAGMGGSGIALNKTTSGTVTLSGVNTYTGATTVSGGRLLVNGSLASGSAVTVNNSGTVLGGTGTINGAVTINSGAAILGGTGSTGQTLTLANNLTLSSGSIIELALGPSGAHSTLARTGSGIWSFQTAQQFAFLDLGATTGTYNNIITGVSNPGNTTSWTITNSGWTGTFSYDGANIDLTLTAVPEPSTWISGALALVVIGCIQRKRFSRLLKRA